MELKLCSDSVGGWRGDVYLCIAKQLDVYFDLIIIIRPNFSDSKCCLQVQYCIYKKILLLGLASYDALFYQ